jgi:hypothetical protein
MVGLGGFSKVFLGNCKILARHVYTKKLHALKVIEKEFIV